jgi:ABC-type Fe3+-hydroxamate transport system substrate-binding protein
VTASLIKRTIGLLGVVLLASAPILAFRQVTDELGRRVTVPGDPHRIICLAPSVTETVYALGLGSEVVGVTDYTDYPPEARSKPRVGGPDNPSLEKIISLHPDLVIATGGLSGEKVAEELGHLGLQVYLVNPQGLRGILVSIEHLGAALHRATAAEALVRRLEQRQAAISARVAGLTRPKVLVVVWYDPVTTAGKNSFITDVIAAAGGRSLTADIPQPWPQISLEEVLRRSPDYILLVRHTQRDITEKTLLSHAGWDQLDALRNHHVIYVDDRLIHPSPVVFDAMEELARELHPQVF